MFADCFDFEALQFCGYDNSKVVSVPFEDNVYNESVTLFHRIPPYDDIRMLEEDNGKGKIEKSEICDGEKESIDKVDSLENDEKCETDSCNSIDFDSETIKGLGDANIDTLDIKTETQITDVNEDTISVYDKPNEIKKLIDSERRQEEQKNGDDNWIEPSSNDPKDDNIDLSKRLVEAVKANDRRNDMETYNSPDKMNGERIEKEVWKDKDKISNSDEVKSHARDLCNIFNQETKSLEDSEKKTWESELVKYQADNRIVLCDYTKRCKPDMWKRFKQEVDVYNKSESSNDEKTNKDLCPQVLAQGHELDETDKDKCTLSPSYINSCKMDLRNFFKKNVAPQKSIDRENSESFRGSMQTSSPEQIKVVGKDTEDTCTETWTYGISQIPKNNDTESLNEFVEDILNIRQQSIDVDEDDSAIVDKYHIDEREEVEQPGFKYREQEDELILKQMTYSNVSTSDVVFQDARNSSNVKIDETHQILPEIIISEERDDVVTVKKHVRFDASVKIDYTVDTGATNDKLTMEEVITCKSSTELLDHKEQSLSTVLVPSNDTELSEQMLDHRSEEAKFMQQANRCFFPLRHTKATRPDTEQQQQENIVQQDFFIENLSDINKDQNRIALIAKVVKSLPSVVSKFSRARRGKSFHPTHS